MIERYVHISRRNIIVLLSLVGSLLMPGVAEADQLVGAIGNSSRWGSSWMDFGQAEDFHAGQTLKITLKSGGATHVLVRLLPVNASPDDPVGIVRNQIYPVSAGVVTVVLDQDYPGTKQISVHGGQQAWNFSLGAGNGPAVIVAIERLP
jgi:hypothetical protein